MHGGAHARRGAWLLLLPTYEHPLSSFPACCFIDPCPSHPIFRYVPVHLGSLHQANALNLFTAVLMLLHALRPAVRGPISEAMGRYGAPLAALGVVSIGVAVTTHY